MKFSEQWLREWANPSVDAQTLGDKLTSLGLELDAITPMGHDHVLEVEFRVITGAADALREK